MGANEAAFFNCIHPLAPRTLFIPLPRRFLCLPLWVSIPDDVRTVAARNE